MRSPITTIVCIILSICTLEILGDKLKESGTRKLGKVVEIAIINNKEEDDDDFIPNTGGK